RVHLAMPEGTSGSAGRWRSLGHFGHYGHLSFSLSGCVKTGTIIIKIYIFIIIVSKMTISIFVFDK
ncbi:MAG: hypothetical protein IJ782_00025, partial [Prevotella sp.]|nr:hypothetical protein [Prevotella sp.]